MPFTLQVHQVFAHPWHRVTQSWWEKYPHPSLPHVKEAWILSRRLDEKGRLVTRRLMCAQQAVPPMLRPFSRGLDTFYAVEESVVDAKERILEFTTRNVSFARVVQAVTKARYVPTPNDEKNSTTYTSEIVVTAKSFPSMIASRIENALGVASQRNANKGVEIVEQLCQELSLRNTNATHAS